MGFWRNCCISTNFFYGRKSTLPCTLFRGAAVPCPYSHIHFAFITQPSRTAVPAGSRRGTAHFRKPQNIRDIFICKKPAADFSSFATKMSRAERAPRTDFYSDRRKLTRRPPRRVCVVNIHKNIRFSFSGKPPSGAGRPASMMPFSRNCTPLKCKRRCKTGEYRNDWFINKPFVCFLRQIARRAAGNLSGFAAPRQALPPSRTHTLRGIHRNGGIP